MSKMDGRLWTPFRLSLSRIFPYSLSKYFKQVLGKQLIFGDNSIVWYAKKGTNV